MPHILYKKHQEIVYVHQSVVFYIFYYLRLNSVSVALYEKLTLLIDNFDNFRLLEIATGTNNFWPGVWGKIIDVCGMKIVTNL